MDVKQQNQSVENQHIIGVQRGTHGNSKKTLLSLWTPFYK